MPQDGNAWKVYGQSWKAMAKKLRLTLKTRRNYLKGNGKSLTDFKQNGDKLICSSKW